MKENFKYVVGYVAVIGIAVYFLQYYKAKERKKTYDNTISEAEALKILSKLK
jgi:heme/copper-type cytochrome/quinol oxidase subunit 2